MAVSLDEICNTLIRIHLYSRKATRVTLDKVGISGTKVGNIVCDCATTFSMKAVVDAAR